MKRAVTEVEMHLRTEERCVVHVINISRQKYYVAIVVKLNLELNLLVLNVEQRD
jgi:hypothetical protein